MWSLHVRFDSIILSYLNLALLNTHEISKISSKVEPINNNVEYGLSWMMPDPITTMM